MIIPDEQHAADIVQTALGQRVCSVQRFSTGLAHYVFDVVTECGDALVARIAREDSREALAGAVYWSERLRPLGVPLPRILAADLHAETAPFAFLLLERLPGTDLGNVYTMLSADEKRTIAAGVVQAQQLTASLPLGHGFGYAASYEAPLPHRTWTDVVRASLARSRARIALARVFDSALVDRAEAVLARFEPYCATIQPRPFLDDTTTKNVLVHDGRLSGIVDVDVVCFGDPLWTVALTQMALLSRAYNLDYVAYWRNALNLTDEQHAALRFYTAVFCLDFMGEVGQVFNKAQAEPVDQQYVQRLSALFEELMGEA
ncbi:MAG TPA: aminoglycoside phosphotransferase family protein [Roseiflexaceae bacterium]|nr:aminoglycoside phosphotransferase family protein [Roseiflexaceae bacterium]